MPIDFGITEEIRNAVIEKLRADGVTEKTISRIKNNDEFIWACNELVDSYNYWKNLKGVFGDYGREASFTMSMTTD